MTNYYWLHGYTGPHGYNAMRQPDWVSVEDVYRLRPNMHRYGVLTRTTTEDGIPEAGSRLVVDLYEPTLTGMATLPGRFPVYWPFDDLDTAIASAVMRQSQE